MGRDPAPSCAFSKHFEPEADCCCRRPVRGTCHSAQLSASTHACGLAQGRSLRSGQDLGLTLPVLSPCPCSCLRWAASSHVTVQILVSALPLLRKLKHAQSLWLSMWHSVALLQKGFAGTQLSSTCTLQISATAGDSGDLEQQRRQLRNLQRSIKQSRDCLAAHQWPLCRELLSLWQDISCPRCEVPP